MQEVLKLVGYLLTAIVAPAVQIFGQHHGLDPSASAGISVIVASAGARMLHLAQPPAHPPAPPLPPPGP